LAANIRINLQTDSESAVQLYVEFVKST